MRLAWETADEAGIIGFKVLRQADGADRFETLNSERLLAAHAGQNTGAAYTFLDSGVQSGAYTYRLEAITPDGGSVSCGDIPVIVPGVQPEHRFRLLLPFVIE